MNLSRWREARKLLASLVGAVLGVGVSVIVPGVDPVTATAITGALTALLVFFTPNDPPDPTA